MINYDALVNLWGADRLVHFPLDRLGPELSFSRDLLPPAGAIPSDVPILFTTRLIGEIQLFDIVELHIGDQQARRLIILGAAQDDPNLFYGLDTVSGAVELLDPIAPGMEQVNSTFVLFVEFLYRFTPLIGVDPVEEAGSIQAIRDELGAADPTAFDSPESWWSIAFAQLAGIG